MSILMNSMSHHVWLNSNLDILCAQALSASTRRAIGYCVCRLLIYFSRDWRVGIAIILSN